MQPLDQPKLFSTSHAAVVATAHALAARGLVHGHTGNVSLRTADGRVLITPTGVGDLITYSRSIADYPAMFASVFSIIVFASVAVTPRSDASQVLGTSGAKAASTSPGTWRRPDSGPR